VGQGDGNGQTNVGSFTLTTTTKGSFSGNLQFGSWRHALSGRFDPSGAASKTFPGPQKTQLTVTISVDLTGSTGMLTGSVSNATWTAVLSGQRTAYNGKDPVSQKGQYTLVIPGNPALTNEPCGDSFAILSVSKTGRIQLSGSLADGTRFTQGSAVCGNGKWPLYAPLYRGHGWVWSWLGFVSTPLGDLTGDMAWFKASVPGDKYYAGGFAMKASAWGSQYTRPGSGSDALSFTQGTLLFNGGGLAGDFELPVSLGRGNQVSATNKTTLQFSLSTGSFKGAVITPGNPKRTLFNGVVLEKMDIGCGSFLGANQAGRVRLSQPVVVPQVMELQTLGSSFAPEAFRSDTNDDLLTDWLWSDGTSTAGTIPGIKDFGSAGARYQTLQVNSPGVLNAVDIGFDGSDGGQFTPLPDMPPQNVGAVYFPFPLTSLQYWASSYNPITNTLDFTGFTSLQSIECFHCSNLQHVAVTHLPSLQRACFEACQLQELDLTGDSNLEELRGALNAYTNIIVAGGVGPHIWHWCVRDNPQLAQQFSDISANFYSLQEFIDWNSNQRGELTFVSTMVTNVEAHNNAYTSADLTGQANLGQCLLGYNLLTNLVLTGCTSLQTLDVFHNYLGGALTVVSTNLVSLDASENVYTSADLTDQRNLLSCELAYNYLTNLVLTGCTALQTLDVSQNNLGGALTFDSTNLQQLVAFGNAFTSIDLTGQSNLLNCSLASNNLTNLVLTDCIALQAVDAHQNYLTTAVLDTLLAQFDSPSVTNLYLNLTSNAELPSAAGYAHYSNLVQRSGVTVLVDGR
jgi:hypothetical protein